MPAKVNDEQIYDGWKDSVRKSFATYLTAARTDVSIAYVREHEKARVVLAVAQREADIEPLTAPDADGNVVVRGRLRNASKSPFALINQGATGVARCERNDALALPAFSFLCPLAPGDTAALVEILATEPARVLGRGVAEVLVARGVLGEVSYVARPVGPPAEARSPEALTRSFLAGVNQVRAAAHLTPLIASPEQAAQNTRLAGAYFSAQLDGRGELSDRIATGLMAGWDIHGTIRRGDFFSLLLGSSRDASALLGYSLESPTGRNVLLDPKARYLALGAVASDAFAGLGVVATTYELFAPGDDHTETASLARRLVTERRARGLAPPVFVANAEVTKTVREVMVENRAVDDVLSDALQSAAASLGGRVSGHVYETTDVGLVPFGPEFFGRKPPRVTLAVTHHRVPGAAWGQYVVFLFTTAPSGDTASAPPHASHL